MPKLEHASTLPQSSTTLSVRAMQVFHASAVTITSGRSVTCVSTFHTMAHRGTEIQSGTKDIDDSNFRSIIEADVDDYFGSFQTTKRWTLKVVKESLRDIDDSTSGGLRALQDVILKQPAGFRLFYEVQYEAWPSIMEELVDRLVSVILAIKMFSGSCANLSLNRPAWSKQKQTRSS